MTTSTSGTSQDSASRSSVSQQSFGELMGEVASDLSALLRQEVELAKAELRQEATKAGKAGAMYAGAAMAAFMVLLFLSIALWWGLSNVMDGGWSALIVAGIWAITAVVLLASAHSRMRRIRGLAQTTETVEEIPLAMKPDLGE